MSFRLFMFILFLILMTFFIGFNLDNRCDVNLIFYTWRDVPVFISVLVAFLCGALAVLPSCLFRPRRKAAPSTPGVKEQGVKKDRGPQKSLAGHYTDQSGVASGRNDTYDGPSNEKKTDVSGKSRTGFLRFFGLDNRQKPAASVAPDLAADDSGCFERNTGSAKRKR